jgi:hypothetical protein
MHLAALFRIGIWASHRRSASFQEIVMAIHTIEYRGYELRAYSQKVFPTFHDPYANGAKRFSSVVNIDSMPSRGGRRYATRFSGTNPATSRDAVDLAVQYGKDILDGKVQAHEL